MTGCEWLTSDPLHVGGWLVVCGAVSLPLGAAMEVRGGSTGPRLAWFLLLLTGAVIYFGAQTLRGLDYRCEGFEEVWVFAVSPMIVFWSATVFVLHPLEFIAGLLGKRAS